MKIPQTFTTEKKLDDIIGDFLSGKQDHNKEGLAIAVRDTSFAGKLYVWKPLMKEPKLVRQRQGSIFDLCYFNNKLYDCGIYQKIYDTLGNKEIIIGDTTITSILGYQNGLFFSELNLIYFTNLKSQKQTMRTRIGEVYALEEHENSFYDAGNYGSIYINNNDIITKPVFRREGTTRALCSHEGVLYDAGYDALEQAFAIKDSLPGNIITARSSDIFALCSFNDELLDGGNYGKVMESFTDKVLLNFGTGYTVTALETIPVSLLEALVNTQQ